jgi:predicted AlkP superfamily phosphohydrolase/phosphomutase
MINILNSYFAVERIDVMIKELLEEIEQLNLNDYSEILFNLYEDEDTYTVEAVFDDDKLIIGRTE